MHMVKKFQHKWLKWEVEASLPCPQTHNPNPQKKLLLGFWVYFKKSLAHTHKMYLYAHTIYIDTYIDTHTHRYMTPIFTQTGICNMCCFVPCFLSLLNLQEYIWRAEICDVDEVELIILKNGLFFCVASKKSLPKPTSQFLLFSSRIFMVLHLDLWPFTANFYIWREIQNKVYF